MQCLQMGKEGHFSMFDHREDVYLGIPDKSDQQASSECVRLKSYLPRNSNASIRVDPCISIAPFITGAGRNASARGPDDLEDKSDVTDHNVITLVTSSEDATTSH